MATSTRPRERSTHLAVFLAQEEHDAVIARGVAHAPPVVKTLCEALCSCLLGVSPELHAACNSKRDLVASLCPPATGAASLSIGFAIVQDLVFDVDKNALGRSSLLCRKQCVRIAQATA
jgi:hypothetical protein